MKLEIFKVLFCFVVSAGLTISISADPVRKHPDNPHYFIYNGKPLLLITSDHHYGAVVNLDFDYVAYLNTLQEFGMNLTRIYTGGYVEMKDAYRAGNPMGPAPDRFILPWKKTAVPGANKHLGTFKYDLNSWDPEYFKRLKDFITRASARNIIVEVVFFNGMYDDRWSMQPMFHLNNIQEAGTCDYQQFTTMTDGKLVTFQKKYVKKIASELYKFDNLIYDISDEPEMQKQDSKEWNSVMLDELISADKYRHIYGETANSASPDFTGDNRISWIPTEYISPMETTLDNDYCDNKPIVDVETSYYPFWYGANPVDESRAEGWYGMVGGLAGLVHLNSDYSVGNPTAAGTDTRTKILPQKQVLMNFMYSLDFIRMSLFSDFNMIAHDALARGIAETGKQYALYIFHPERKWEDWPQGQTASRFNINIGWFVDTINMHSIPPGEYKIEWINPSTGELLESSDRKWNGGELILYTPRYFTDIALRLRSISASK